MIEGGRSLQVHQGCVCDSQDKYFLQLAMRSFKLCETSMRGYGLQLRSVLHKICTSVSRDSDILGGVVRSETAKRLGLVPSQSIGVFVFTHFLVYVSISIPSHCKAGSSACALGLVASIRLVGFAAPRNRTSPVGGKMGRGRWHGRLWRFWLRSRVAGRSDGKRQSYLSSGHQQMGPRHQKYQKSLCACLGFGYMMPSLSVWRMPQTHDTAPTCSTMLCLPSQARSAIHLVATVANTKRRGLHSLLGPGRLNTCTESAGLPLQHLEECRD